MKTLTKRELVRKPSIVSSLKPGQSLMIQDGESNLVVTRKSEPKMEPEQIEAELQNIFAGAPVMDCQAVLDDSRD